MAAPAVLVGPSDGLDVNTPLLDPEIQAAVSEPSPNHGEIWVVTPLPKKQVAVLGFAALAEPISVNFIYPFINEMIAGISNGPKQLAYRSGIFFGCFAFSQFLCVYFWGALSDRIGRKYVILMCFATGILSAVAFGMSTTFLQAFVFRMIAGASYGDVPVIRSAMGDVTDSTNQARAFSFIPLAYMVGTTLAPLIGGFLSHPVERFPKRFGHSQFFRDHPYALPCFACATCSLLAFTVVAVFLKETLQDVSHHDKESVAEAVVVESEPVKDLNPAESSSLRSSTPPPNYGSTINTTQPPSSSTSPAPDDQPQQEEGQVSGFTPLAASNAPPSPSSFKILKDVTVRKVLASYFFLALISTSNDVIFALWMFFPVKDGGVGFTPAQIATTLSTGSVLGTLMMVFIFPALHHRVGTILIYRCAMSLDILLIALYPIVHLIAQSSVPKYHHEHPGSGGDDFISAVARYGSELAMDALALDTGGGDSDGSGKGIFGVWKGVPAGVIAGIMCMLFVKACVSLAWGCNMILVTASVPSPRSLGTVNSIGQMAASLARAIGPPIYTSIFAVSLGSGVLGGKGIIWIFMGGMACISVMFAFLVREGDQDWRRSRRA